MCCCCCRGLWICFYLRLPENLQSTCVVLQDDMGRPKTFPIDELRPYILQEKSNIVLMNGTIASRSSEVWQRLSENVSHIHKVSGPSLQVIVSLGRYGLHSLLGIQSAGNDVGEEKGDDTGKEDDVSEDVGEEKGNDTGKEDDVSEDEDSDEADDECFTVEGDSVSFTMTLRNIKSEELKRRHRHHDPLMSVLNMKYEAPFSDFIKDVTFDKLCIPFHSTATAQVQAQRIHCQTACVSKMRGCCIKSTTPQWGKVRPYFSVRCCHQ